MNSFDTNLWDRDEIDSSYSEETEQSEDQVYTGSEMFEEEIEDTFNEEEPSLKVSSTIDNARIRLEQGRLYEMLIKHDLFDGVDAMPEAVSKVQSEIKEFIVERLEILLGMRSEKQKEIHHVVKESQFNEIEVQALKMIARKVTKGASDSVSSVPSRPRNELNTIKNSVQPVNRNAKSVEQIKPMGKAQASMSQKPVEKKTTTVIEKRQPQRTAVTKQQSNTRRIVDESKKSPPTTVDEIAKQDIKYIESLKSMSLEEAGKVVAEKYNRPKYPYKIDQESVNRIYTTKMAVNEEAHSFAKLLAAAQRK
jgi:hypothetical protein